jgi:hypothetical protein
MKERLTMARPGGGLANPAGGSGRVAMGPAGTLLVPPSGAAGRLQQMADHQRHHSTGSGNLVPGHGAAAGVRYCMADS